MTERLRALVVDDEESVRFFLQEALEEAGYVVRTASNGRDALDLLRSERFALILLDLRLGGYIDGQRILEMVKWRWPQTVVVILTAHGSLESAISAIQEGVDGYLLKPVEPEEIVRIVQSARQRKLPSTGSIVQAPSSGVLEYEPFSLNLRLQEVTVDGELVDLTLNEYRVLAHLMQNAFTPVASEDLVQVTRHYRCTERQEAQQIIKWCIYRLRRKVEPDPSKPKHIVNVRGFGYMFEV